MHHSALTCNGKTVHSVALRGLALDPGASDCGSIDGQTRVAAEVERKGSAVGQGECKPPPDDQEPEQAEACPPMWVNQHHVQIRNSGRQKESDLFSSSILHLTKKKEGENRPTGPVRSACGLLLGDGVLCKQFKVSWAFCPPEMTAVSTARQMISRQHTALDHHGETAVPRDWADSRAQMRAAEAMMVSNCACTWK
eukprot:350629-Pelagomonas_calceolata.AAC.3